jgi:hypothetical protein
MKYIAVIIWMASPGSKPTITALSGERAMTECLAAVDKAVKAPSANVVTGGCMTKEALDFIRAML